MLLNKKIPEPSHFKNRYSIVFLRMSIISILQALLFQTGPLLSAEENLV